MIIPSILSLAYLGQPIAIFFDSLADLDLSPVAMWMASVSTCHMKSNGIYITRRGNTLSATCYAASMVVNVLVTSLIVFKIFKVLREVKCNNTSDEKSSSITGGRKYRSIIFVIIESGMILLAIQVTRLVVVAPG